MGNPYLEKIAEVSKKEAAAYGTAVGAHRPSSLWILPFKN